MRAFLYHILNDLIVDEYRKHKASSLTLLMEKGLSQASVTPNAYSTFLTAKQ